MMFPQSYQADKGVGYVESRFSEVDVYSLSDILLLGLYSIQSTVLELFALAYPGYSSLGYSRDFAYLAHVV